MSGSNADGRIYHGKQSKVAGSPQSESKDNAGRISRKNGNPADGVKRSIDLNSDPVRKLINNIAEPSVSKVMRFEGKNETELERRRSQVYEIERNGEEIWRETSPLFYVHAKSGFSYSYYKRGVYEIDGYDNAGQTGAGNYQSGSGNEKQVIVKKSIDIDSDPIQQLIANISTKSGRNALFVRGVKTQ
ncbi:MAG: hypothetical protein IJU64_02775 [Bacilli bacterium]|nr:hypothetical protein [Bacilli bacterium]